MIVIMYLRQHQR